VVADFFAIGRFAALILYQEMPGQIRQTQGVGAYCEEVY
jgi:hypothetical protein